MTHPVEHPTYLGDIRFLFTPGDMGCMAARGIDLRTYEGVKFNAVRIYFHVREGTMPPPPLDRRWPAEQVETFYNWMRDGYPRGVAPQASLQAAALTAGRIRREISTLDPDGPEIAKLRKAFESIMERDLDHPQSYFALAANHWLPTPNVYCRHHENAYNPWHRAYLLQFEDALRSVEGCEDVTLPYWDITSDSIPAIFGQEPFDKYTIPRQLVSLDGGRTYPAGTETTRHPDNAILDNLKNAYDVPGRIRTVLAASRWEEFNGWNADDPWIDHPQAGLIPIHSGIIAAHDAGHVAIGTTMENQDIAAFDPMFWFFHCNWDRLWWRWQQVYTATTLEDFKTTLIDDGFWLTDSVANSLQPFGIGADATIDLNAMNVDYVHPEKEIVPPPERPVVASAAARGGVAIPDPDRLLVRVRGIDRLQIPGSFIVVLTADGEPIRRLPVFQSTSPRQCSTCRKSAVFTGLFELHCDEIAERRLAARIEMIGQTGRRSAFPLTQAGSPRIDVRLKMVE